MSLDSVELVLAIEEDFGIDIPNSDAEKMYLVGDVYEWLKVRIATTDPIECRTQKIFFKLRRALIENYRLERRSIYPDTRLTDLLSLDDIRDGWPFLRMFIDLHTPPLKVEHNILELRLTSETLTLRELVRSLIYINRKDLEPQRETELEIWNRLVQVFVRQLNVLPNEVIPEASITKDLGCD
jgi:acyl carrier protein